jgi:diacylglycerol kinase family enzyme
MRVTVIINRSAGSVSIGGDIDAALRAIELGFERHGIDAKIIAEEGDAIAEAAVKARDMAERGELDAVVVGGGDGTIRSVANVLAGSSVPLGILPMGTLNHFARDLKLPLDLDLAIDVISHKELRTVDLGSVNGAIFVNNSSVGVYPYMVADRDRRRGTSGLGKWPAMALAGLRALKRFPFRRLTMTAEGSARPYRTAMLFVGNNEYDLRLFSLGRRQQLDLGRLHVYVARSQSRWSFIMLILRALLGFGRTAQELDQLESLAFEVRSRTSRLPVALDGEVQVMQPPLRYRIMPGALKVFAPAPAG